MPRPPLAEVYAWLVNGDAATAQSNGEMTVLVENVNVLAVGGLWPDRVTVNFKPLMSMGVGPRLKNLMYSQFSSEDPAQLIMISLIMRSDDGHAAADSVFGKQHKQAQLVKGQ